jgi:polysaccharide biosynthesis protein PslH
MKLLFITHDIPSPIFSDTLPIFNYIKYLYCDGNHTITLLSYTSNTVNDQHMHELMGYCTMEKPINFQNPHQNRKIGIFTLFTFLSIVKNNLMNLRENIRHRIFLNVLYLFYSKEMESAFHELLQKETYDAIISTRPMSIFVVKASPSIPTVVVPYDAVYEWNRQVFEITSGFEKMGYYINFQLTKLYESKFYREFDRCVVVTREDKQFLQKLDSTINAFVLPNGVTMDYFHPQVSDTESRSLVFVSNMDGHPTIENILWFYHQVFPRIAERFPSVRLYLVGRNPARQIMDLARDHRVCVTGFVTDTREYLSKCEVFIAPMIRGTGIKNKVLEAMAMGKPVVSTSYGTLGIHGEDGVHFFMEDEPDRFARRVIDLLENSELRDNMGRNASRLIHDNYQWDRIIHQLYQMLIGIKKAENP